MKKKGFPIEIDLITRHRNLGENLQIAIRQRRLLFIPTACHCTVCMHTLLLLVIVLFYCLILYK